MYTKNKIIKFFLKFVYKNVDRLVVISNNSKKLINIIYKNLNLVVIPNGVDRPKIFNKYEKQKLRKELDIKNHKLVLFVGRLTPVKSVDSLIEGFARVNSGGKKLLIIGEGEEETRLMNLVKKFNIEEDVIFISNVKSDNVYKYMAISDVLVLPSLMETGGNVVLEAVMSGLPVIATRVGWADDFVEDDVNGFFVEKKNPKDIENKLRKVLNNHKLLIRMKKNMKQTKNKLISWQECARFYEREYKNLVLSKDGR